MSWLGDFARGFVEPFTRLGEIAGNIGADIRDHPEDIGGFVGVMLVIMVLILGSVGAIMLAWYHL